MREALTVSRFNLSLCFGLRVPSCVHEGGFSGVCGMICATGVIGIAADCDLEGRGRVFIRDGVVKLESSARDKKLGTGGKSTTHCKAGRLSAKRRRDMELDSLARGTGSTTISGVTSVTV